MTVERRIFGEVEADGICIEAEGDEDLMDNLQRLTGPRTGQVLSATVSVPGAGWPNHR